MTEIALPEVFDFLLETPARWKVCYGGRGAAKTESFARALIILCMKRKLRILCLRELQNSIAESTKQTIELAIEEMGYSREFEITATSIVSKRTGSEFLFMGLRYNINKIKSLARIDIAWVEEAVNVSYNSWEKLGPSIRGRPKDDPKGQGGPFGKGPEIWISFNPELDDDETYKRFILNPPPEIVDNEPYCIVKKVNHTDNPFFPPDLQKDMEIARLKDEVAYLHVWEGHTKQVLEGAIFAEEIKKVIKENRIGKVPYVEGKPVHTFWDLGHSDQTAIWFIQTIGVEYNIINFYQNNLKKIPFYIEHLQSLNYVYGKDYLPHDGDNETLASISPAAQLRKAGRHVVIVHRPPKKLTGIQASRTVFDLCNFDEKNTADGMQCLRRYAYAVNEDGGWSKEPAHDQYSHGADAFQTFALSLKSEQATKKTKKAYQNNIINLRSNVGWMG